MKKLLAITAMALIMSGAAAYAEDAAPMKDHGPGKMFEKTDANKDGVISKDEFMARHEEKFKELDTNSDGKLTKEELDAGREKWKAEHPRKEKEAAPK